MKTKSTLFLLLVLLVASVKSQPVFQWAKAFGSTQNDYAYSVATDVSGNVYHTGYFSGVVDFDPGPGVYTLTSLGAEDIYVCKYDMNGNLMWVEQMGGTSTDIAQGIAIDPTGNIYVSGYFSGAVDLDPGVPVFSVTSQGSTDIFIAKLSQNGNFIWAKSMGGTSGDIINSLKVDASSNVYTTGSFRASVDFDPGAGVATFTSQSSSDVFINKLDVNGNFVFNKCFNGNGADEANSIDVDANGNIYTTGYFSTTCDFDPGPGTYSFASVGGLEIFISKLDASGNFVWAKTLGTGGAEVGYGITTDVSGNVYSTGYFTNSIDFDPGPGTFTLTSSGAYDIYIHKLNSSGNFQWVKKIGGSGNDAGGCIKIANTGDIFTSGYYSGLVDFDPGIGTYTLNANGGTDMCLLQLDNAGNFVWAMGHGGVGNDFGFTVYPDPLGNIYASGYFSGTSDFDPGIGTYTLTSAGMLDAYVLKLSYCSAPPSPTNITSLANQTVCSNNQAILTASALGTVLWFSTPSSTNVLGSGSTFIAPLLGVGNYTYYAETFSCIVSSTRTPFTFTVVPGVNISATSNASLLCIGESATLTAAGSATSYSWSTGSTNTMIVVSPTVTSTYTLIGSVANGCTATFTLTQLVSTCAAIEQLSNDPDKFIKVFPNPFGSNLNIETGSQEISLMTLTNSLGEIIYTEKIRAKANLDLERFPSGIYFLSLEQAGKLRTAKVIKE